MSHKSEAFFTDGNIIHNITTSNDRNNMSTDEGCSNKSSRLSQEFFLKNLIYSSNNSSSSSMKSTNCSNHLQNSSNRHENSSNQHKNRSNRHENSFNRHENSSNQYENCSNQPQNSSNRHENCSNQYENCSNRCIKKPLKTLNTLAPMDLNNSSINRPNQLDKSKLEQRDFNFKNSSLSYVLFLIICLTNGPIRTGKQIYIYFSNIY